MKFPFFTPRTTFSRIAECLFYYRKSQILALVVWHNMVRTWKVFDWGKSTYVLRYRSRCDRFDVQSRRIVRVTELRFCLRQNRQKNGTQYSCRPTSYRLSTDWPVRKFHDDCDFSFLFGIFWWRLVHHRTIVRIGNRRSRVRDINDIATVPYGWHLCDDFFMFDNSYQFL